MSALHILAGDGNNSYSVVIHVTTPVGNNTVGVPWTTCLINSGMAKTSLPVGTGTGQITTAEKAQVEAGTVIEGRFTWRDNPAWDTNTRNADLNSAVASFSAAKLQQLAAQLTYYGYTQ